MIKPRRSEECDHCQRFSGYLSAEYLVCAVHPLGPAEIPCPDFAEVVGQWEPLGAGYYDCELVLQPEHYLTTEERLEILETHPLFTGVCPKCGATIPGEDLVHWDCAVCGWKDDSVV
ncbi:MAG: hypothetical protein MH252_07260 [Thermosynechococcaceae cyanobacterium MS004]|nr:hypothetical protein [Thermosynechococcaceae cyanobacterium MS004]